MEGQSVSTLTKNIAAGQPPYNHCDLNFDGNRGYGMLCVTYPNTGLLGSITTAVGIAYPGTVYGLLLTQFIWSGPTYEVYHLRAQTWGHCRYTWDGG